MKIFYISNTCFSDCEIDLLKVLSLENEVIYSVVTTKYNSNFSALEIENSFKNSNVKARYLKLKYRLRDPRQLLTYHNLFKSINKEKPDVIYINNWGDIYFNLLANYYLAGKKVVIGIHDVEYHSGSSLSFIFNLSNKLFYKRFRFFLTFSKTQSELLKTIASVKLDVFTIPLALKDFGPKKEILNNERKVKFLFFGNILSYKGLDILLTATNRLREKYNNFELIIAGRCNNWDELYAPLTTGEDYIKKEIRFVENSEIPDFFSDAHYLVLPYRDVTQSGPLMIAYNYNLPIIASDNEGFKEFITDGVTGFLFEKNNDIALTKILEEAITRSQDEYDQLIKNIDEYKTNKLTVNVIAKSYKKMFTEIYTG